MHRQPADIRELRPIAVTGRPAPLPEAAFELCGWEVEPRMLTAARNGSQVRVEPRLMQLLVCLRGAKGGPVTREAIMAAVWGHEHVTEDALNRLVSRLRRLLSEDLACDAVIETLPRVGYRLTSGGTHAADATRGNGATPHGTAEPATDRTRPDPALARSRWALYAGGAAVLLAACLISLRVLEQASPRSVLGDPSPRTESLTSLPGHEIQATLSPDGNQVAFARRVEPGAAWDIYVRPIASDTLLRVTADDGNNLRPAWSPDGQWLAYLHVVNEQCDVRLVSPFGGPARTLAPCDATLDEDLAWTADSSGLVFRARNGRGLSRLTLASGAMEPLTDPPEGEHDALPAYSPDGTTLAFGRWFNFGVADVYVAKAGAPARRLTFDNLKLHGLVWDSDGRHLLYSSNRGGTFGLWRIDIDGREPERVAVPARTVDAPVLSRDGRRLVYEEWVGQANIFALDAHAVQPAPLPVTTSTRWDWNPQPAPDGARFAFVSDRSGPVELWVAEAGDSEPQRLTHFGGPYVGAPAWSTNGQRIAFESPATDGNFDIYEVAVEGGAPVRLTDDPAQDRFPHYAADGRSLLYASRRSGDWEIWRLDLATRASTRVTEGGGYFALSDATGAVYYSRVDANGIWRLDPAGGAPTLVLPQLEPIDCANWTLAGSSIWFVARDAERDANLAELDLATGAVRTVAPLPRMLYKSGLAADAGGRVYYASVVSSESDLVMAEAQAD
jgi:Tol biopolymer transport system component/DNA-binding winged helix-turn-helix (wHTH) protein